MIPMSCQSELQTLAGPSAGPNGGQIYIDGFTGGTLPPKDPFAKFASTRIRFPRYDKLGYGRVRNPHQTGPGSVARQVSLNANTSAFNSRNPFEIIPAGAQPPGYNSRQFSAEIGGPLVSKKAHSSSISSAAISNELSIVSAQIVDPATFAIVPFSDAVSNPRTRTNLSPRIDYQVSASNTLTVRTSSNVKIKPNERHWQFNLPRLHSSIIPLLV